MSVPPNGGWSDVHEKRARDAGRESYAAWCAEIEAEKGVDNICGAWATSAERPCRKPRTPGPGNPKGRCKRHGADSPRGIAHYRFGTGERIYSEALDGILADAYERSLEKGSGDQVSLRQSIALADGREAQLVGRLRDGDVSVGRARDAAADVREALREGDEDAARDALDVLDDAVDAFEAHERTWAKLQALWDDKRKLSDSERRRLEAVHEAVTRDRLMALVGYLVKEIRRAAGQHVRDDDARRALLSDLSSAIARLGEGTVAGDPTTNGAGPA